MTSNRNLSLRTNRIPGQLDPTAECSKGKLDYIDEGWEGAGRTAVHKQIYDTIKNHGKRS